MLSESFVKNTKFDREKNFLKKKEQIAKKKKIGGALDILVESGGSGDFLKGHAAEYTLPVFEDSITFV